MNVKPKLMWINLKKQQNEKVKFQKNTYNVFLFAIFEKCKVIELMIYTYVAKT